MKIRFLGYVSAAAFAMTVALAGQAGAASGTVIYAKANCFVFQTDQGATLVERSGGDGAQEGQNVSGPLDEFGYQELSDESGKQVLVGWVQNYGVKDDAEIEDFKKSCR